MRIERDPHFSRNVFEEPGYRDHYVNLTGMMKNHLHLDRLRGKKVLDLGCGYGWWGQSLQEHGADVSFVDGRESNLHAVQQQCPNADIRLVNVEAEPLPKADLILCMGLIYHISNPRALFNKMIAVSPRVFIDTTCMDHDGEFIVYHSEVSGSQYSLTGSACRPSPKWIINQLHEAGYVRVEDISDAIGNRPPQAGFPGLVYDWDFRRTCGWRRDERTLRRMFMASKYKTDELLK
jgi:SAM-dependent methyltransferase